MDRRERLDDAHAAFLAALDGRQSEIWTALPAQVVTFDPVAVTISAQPTIQACVKNKIAFDSCKKPGDVYPWVTMPVLVDVPVVFPGAGGYSLTFEPAVGDEVLIVFSSRCIDNWWYAGGIGAQAELRMHDLSDGFAVPGLRSRPRPYAGGVKPGVAQLRADDGQSYVEMAGGHVVNIVAPGGVNITGPVHVTGNTTFSGTVTANGHTIDERHTHGGVTPGGSNTGGVS